MTRARDLSKLLGTANNGVIPNSNLGVSFENISDSGTAGTKVASGTTGQRGSTAGQIRFNTTTGLAEYYTGTEFKIIDTPPTVTAISPLEVDSTAGGNITFTVTGTNFQSGAVTKFVGNDGTEITASTTTVTNSTTISAVIARSSFVGAKEPYDVKVINASGLLGILDNQINVDVSPAWSTASGSLGSFSNYDTVSVSATATDADSDTIVYSVQSGTLPTGLSLNSSTGAITGTPTGATSATTSSFTLRATANSKTADRAFTITVSPAVQAFTSNGSWSVPAGVSTVKVLVVAGGGGGGTTSNGNQSLRASAGGAGGLIYISNWNVSGASSYSISIGQGGGSTSNGGNTTISGGSKTLTALGGGYGGWSDNTDFGSSGGSGGSKWYQSYTGSSATQPANTSDGVNTYNGTGFGNKGGDSFGSSPYGGGGGGAGSAGMNASTAASGASLTDEQSNTLTGDTSNGLGGTGKYFGNIFGNQYGESGFFASGGTSAGYTTVATKAHLGGGGIGDNRSTSPNNALSDGQVNTGGGAGGGGNGGSGIVLISY
jgi:hypothetical protein